jgi:hypothetical protein
MNDEKKTGLTEEKLDAFKRGLDGVSEFLPADEQKESNLEGQKEIATIEAESEKRKEEKEEQKDKD